jgi:hypothetical protein
MVASQLPINFTDITFKLGCTSMFLQTLVATQVESNIWKYFDIGKPVK